MEFNWPQLLQDFGPFALLPFTVLVIERLAASRARDKRLSETTRNRVYAAAWIMIFLLCAAVVGFWVQSRPTEAMMRGKISGLNALQRLRATGPETANVRVFTYRDPQQVDRLFWRTFSNEPLDETTELVFLIDNSTKDTEETWQYFFPANRGYYRRSMELNFTYNPSTRNLSFNNPVTHKLEEFSGARVVLASFDPVKPDRFAWTFPWFSVVHAQGKPSVSTVMANLEADDPLIRLTARKQLAALGPEATREMDRALGRFDSSYRVKLGVIVAANQMPRFTPDSFNSSAWCEVWRATLTGDETMRAQANLLLKKQTKPVDPSVCKELRLKSAQTRTVDDLKVYAKK